jgi:hypothetical protein
LRTLLRSPSPSLRALALLGAVLPAAALADNSISRQFWPEFDAYVDIDERSRLMFSAAATHAREDDVVDGKRSFQDAQFTVNFDYTLEPVLRSDVPRAEWSKNRLLWARLGFEYGRSVGSTADNYRSYTGLAEVSGRYPLQGTLWATSRARVDLRDINGEGSQRYRLRLGAEWKAQAFEHPVDPYGSAEFVYDTRYERWSRLALKTGLETPIADNWRLEPYLELQLNKPDGTLSRVLGIGVTLKVYFDR